MNDDQDRLVPPVVAPTAHLSENQVAEVVLTSPAQKHLDDCAWCRGRRRAMSDDNRLELAALLSELDDIVVDEDALKSAAGWTLPTGLSTYISGSGDESPPVAAGQLWKLSWLSHETLGVVVEHSSWLTRVAPLTTDVHMADEYTLVADADATSLNCATATFMRACATVPTFTLARYLGDLGPVGGHDASDALHQLDIAILDSAHVSAGIPIGAPLAEHDWDRHELLDALQETMEWFESAASAMLDDEGAIAGGGPKTTGTTLDLQSELARVTDLVGLMSSTGIKAGRLVDLKSGRARPDQDEVVALGAHFGGQISSGHSENERLAALELVSEPANRAHWLEAAHASGNGEADGPRTFLMEILNSPLAARTVYGTTSTASANASVDEWKRVLRDRIGHLGRGHSQQPNR